MNQTESLRKKLVELEKASEFDGASQILLATVKRAIDELEAAELRIDQCRLLLKAVEAKHKMVSRGWDIGTQSPRGYQYKMLDTASTQEIQDFIIYLNSVGKGSSITNEAQE